MRLIFCALIVTAFATPAHAVEPYTSGLHYTVMGKSNATRTLPGNFIQHKNIQTIETNTLETEKAETPQDETPAVKVWNRYKELAGGVTEDAQPAAPAPQNAAPAQTTEAAPASATPQPTAAKPATGITGLLQRYQEAKDERSQIHTLSVQRPTVNKLRQIEPAAR